MVCLCKLALAGDRMDMLMLLVATNPGHIDIVMLSKADNIVCSEVMKTERNTSLRE